MRFYGYNAFERNRYREITSAALPWPTRRKPVKGGLDVDAHAHSLDITSTMRAAPFVSSAACSDVALLQWQAVLPWIFAVRLFEAPLRLPTWLNDDLRPVPRLQLCWASEFNSPVGLQRWTSCTSYEVALPKSRIITYPVVLAVLRMLDGSRL